MLQCSLHSVLIISIQYYCDCLDADQSDGFLPVATTTHFHLWTLPLPVPLPTFSLPPPTRLSGIEHSTLWSCICILFLADSPIYRDGSHKQCESQQYLDWTGARWYNWSAGEREERSRQCMWSTRRFAGFCLHGRWRINLTSLRRHLGGHTIKYF